MSAPQGLKKLGSRLNPRAPEFITLESQGYLQSPPPSSQLGSAQESLVSSPIPDSNGSKYNPQGYGSYQQFEHVDRAARRSSLFPPEQPALHAELARRADTAPAPSLLGAAPAVAPLHRARQRKRSGRDRAAERKLRAREQMTLVERYRDMEEDARGFSDDETFFPGPE